MTNFSDLFEQFLKEKQYIDSVTAKTLRTYRDLRKAFERYYDDMSVSGVKAFVISASQPGFSPCAFGERAKFLINKLMPARRRLRKTLASV